ncbi:unnamed protein product, partial [Mesorhabditis belari]|uniref:HAT C-terminal dimerisation domain-containing protein n=1 Tax=Mesorhabditis belari TaxID=2138241 RepID=A0AAF3EQS5_9BILA
MAVSKKTRLSTLQLEIDDYVHFCTKEARPSTTENLYLWWFQNKARFKNLYPIAVQYMSPPASSVSSERVFSMCGLIWKNSRRQRMAPTTLKSALIE